MDTRKLIVDVQKAGGTELHLKIGSKPLMRKNKFLRKIDLPEIQPDDMKALLGQLLNEEELKKFEKFSAYEANYFGKPPCNFRLTLYHSQQKPIAIIKIISGNIPSLKDIKFPEHLSNVTEYCKGLFILAGPARSGISTSLASLVEQMNKTQQKHILLIEDPIEFNFEPKGCRISQRQFRKDINMIEQGINFAKRMDVDVLVIGDLKREIPFKSVLEYVAGGHFVVLSMQTLGMVNTLEKFIFSFSEADREYVCQVLSENLVGLCSQALISDMAGQKVVPVHETLVMNPTTASIIQKGKISQLEPNITSCGEGSMLFAQNIQKLYMKSELDRNAGESFQEFYRGMRA